jgi:hypothetical protein
MYFYIIISISVLLSLIQISYIYAQLESPKILSVLDENNKKIINNSITKSKSISFNFHKSNNTFHSFTSCSLDQNKPYKFCESPIRFNNLDQGYHTFELMNVFFVDINPNGTVSSAMFSNPITFNWNVK